MPTVSVICPAYNAAAFIEPTLQSVFGQTYQDFDFIVVDDGSTDNTRQILEKYADKIRYVYKENGGQSSARNVGIKLAQGKYIALIDHDDLWLENKLELQVREIETSRDIDMVTCGCIFFRDDRDLNVEIPKINSLNRKQLINQLLVGNTLGSCSKILIRRECFDSVGLFDESLRMAEDWDLYLRIAQTRTIRCVEQPLVKYRWHERNYSSQSADVNLTNELTFLSRIFSLPQFQKKRLVRARAFAERCLCAAWMFREAGDIRRGRKCVWRALLYDPSCIRTRLFLGMVRTLFFPALCRPKPSTPITHSTH